LIANDIYEFFPVFTKERQVTELRTDRDRLSINFRTGNTLESAPKIRISQDFHLNE